MRPGHEQCKRKRAAQASLDGDDEDTSTSSGSASSSPAESAETVQGSSVASEDVHPGRTSVALRQGRWRHPEAHYTELLIQGFKRGLFPLPRGTKLSNFLGVLLHW